MHQMEFWTSQRNVIFVLIAQSASKNMAALINEATLITTKVLKQRITRCLITCLNGTTSTKAVKGAARITENNFICGTEECSTEKCMPYQVRGFARLRCCREENLVLHCDLAVVLKVQQ